MSPQIDEPELQDSGEDASPGSSRGSRQTRVLTLNDGEHHDSTLYRLEKGWVLQFRLGASLLGRRVTIYVNHPASSSPDPKEFDRHTYHILQWKTDGSAADTSENVRDGVTSSGTDGTAIYAEILLSQAGSFHYYFTHDGSKELSSNGSGFFLVDPELRVGPSGQEEILALDCIQCQTVLAKCLGPFPSWEAKLRVSAESGYNMIHFTPIQKLGGSNSSYSLSDQLALNPIFSTPEKKVSFDDVETLVMKLKEEWKVLSVCDIVLNHSANESAWLRQHPECTYNLCNSPHLRPAYLLDALLAKLSSEIAAGDWASSGVPPNIHTEEHLAALRTVLHGFCLPKVRIPELRMINVPALVAEFSKLASERVAPTPIVISSGDSNHGKPENLKITQDPKFQRLQSSVDMEQALLLFNVYRSDCFDEETRLRRCTAAFRARLEELNRCAWDEGMSHISAAVENVIAHVRYHFVSGDGPKQACVSEKTPLVPRYFKALPKDPLVVMTMQEEERLMYSAQASQIMAHNGWVMNDDPLRNFAAPDSDVYLRRELIAWGDSVKLRYGDKPEDCPYLWQHMREYVEQTARIFHGVRLDNCHSTPIPVAEYLLDAARRIRPDLFVVAELFTNSDQKDNIFVNRLGITSLIREAMSAWDPHELGRLVYRYGGEPVGAFTLSMTRPLVPAVAHALFLDVTHDNPSPVQMRSPYDLLPSAALVASASCASGSTRGYDEIVPHHIHVVNEARQYPEWLDDSPVASPQFVNIHSGIIAAKKALNKLHFELGKSAFNQVYVDQVDPDVVAVTRHCPKTHRSVVLIAHCAFSRDGACVRDASRLAPLRVEGTVDRVVQAMPEEDPKDVIRMYDGGNVAVFVVRFQFCSQRGKERIEILPMSLEKCEGLEPCDDEEKASKERKPRGARKPIPPNALSRDGGGSSDDESTDRSSSPEIKSTGQPSLRYILLPKESSGDVENGESAKKKRALPTEGSNTPRKSTMDRCVPSPAGSSSKRSDGARRALRDKDISGLLEEDEDDDEEEEGGDAVQPQYQSSILSPSRMKLKRIVEAPPVAAAPPGTPKRKVARSENNESPCLEFGSITKGSGSATPSLKKTTSSKGAAASVKTPARSGGMKSKTPRTPSDQSKTTPRSLKNVSARKRLQLLADMGLSGGSGGIAERGSHAGPLATPLSPLGEARARLHVSATPKCLPCRDEEFSSVYSFIEDKILDGVGGCMYVCGVPGTGKTATVRMAVERLKEESQKGNVPEFEFAEINGMRVTEPRRAYSQLLKALTGRVGVSPEEARDALEQRFSRPAPRRLSTLLLVDELDLLCTRRQDVVYNLMDWPSRAHSRLVVITIANTMDLPERVLMSKVCSRMGLTRLTFHPYTFQQLQEIVMSRMEGLKAFDPDAVQLVARKVAAVSGDARRALDICRRAAECAESELLGQEKQGNQTPTARRKSLKAMKGVMVSMRHVDQAVSEMISTSKAKAIQSCSEMEKLFLQSVASEVERTGVEEAGFERVHSVFRTLCTYSGFRLPTVTDTMGICWRLGSLRLLLTEPSSRADILQRVMLNVDVDSVHYALRVDQKQ